MHLQLLFDSESKKFLVWTSRNYPSFPGSNESSVHLDLGSAKDCFLSKFKRRTGLHWDDRHSHPQLEKWVFLEINPREVPLITKDVSELPQKVKDVLEIIFKEISLQTYSSNLACYGRQGVSTNNLQEMKLRIGLAVLKKQIELGKAGCNGKMIQNLAGFYQRLVLTPDMEPLSSPDEARQESDTIELLLKSHIAGEISKKSGYSSLTLGQISQAIGLAKMDPGMSFCDPGHVRR